MLNNFTAIRMVEADIDAVVYTASQQQGSQ
jgi:hypothetical protein